MGQKERKLKLFICIRTVCYRWIYFTSNSIFIYVCLQDLTTRYITKTLAIQTPNRWCYQHLKFALGILTSTELLFCRYNIRLWSNWSIRSMSHHCISQSRSLCRGFGDLEACNHGKSATEILCWVLSLHMARSQSSVWWTLMSAKVVGLIVDRSREQYLHTPIREFILCMCK